jgi:hypothetical protein
MKKSGEPVEVSERLDLEFPDWSGMDDSSDRITPEAAFRLCEFYPKLLRKEGAEPVEDRAKVDVVEFVL